MTSFPRKSTLHSRFDLNSGPKELRPERESLRDRKSLRTRRELAKAAVHLFEQKGFAATTIEEITSTADYSTSTFFRLFGDKDEVVFFDFTSRLQEFRTLYSAVHGNNAWRTIQDAFIQYANVWDDEEDGALGRRRAKLFHDEPALQRRFLAKTAEWEDSIAELLGNEFGKGPIGELSSRLIAGAAVVAFRAAWRAQLAGDDLTLVECVQSAFDRLEHISSFFQA